MILATDYPLMDIIWTMLVFFVWIMWFWTLIVVLSDVFSRHDIGGWHKAVWVVVMLFLPLLGVLIYLIADGKGMAERRAKDFQAQQDMMDARIRTVAGGATGEIAKGKELLDSGAITQEEFDALKSKALS